MVPSTDIFIRIEGKAGRITLTRPEALNALTHEMATSMELALIAWANDDAVELVIVDSEGQRAFCAGGDIQKLYSTGVSGDFAYGRQFWADEYRLNALIAAYPKPYVAVMDGIVMGGGVGISAHGSHRITTQNTLFAMPECGIGLVPDVGGNFILSRSPGNIGEYLATTGTRLEAADTIYSGFGDVFVDADKVPNLLNVLCLSGNCDVISEFASDPEVGFLIEKETLISKFYKNGNAAQIASELLASSDEWLQKQGHAMQRGCPLSVSCSLELVRQSGDLTSIKDVLALEYRFTYRSMSQGDFIEGIRAQVIDKDRAPKWRVADLNGITQNHVNEMLASLGSDELNL